MPSAGNVDPPEWLGEQGVLVWREYAAKVRALGLLTELDIDAFAQGCALFAFCRAADPGSSDHLKALREALTVMGRFGFTPADRAKLSVTPKKDDPFDVFLSKSK